MHSVEERQQNTGTQASRSGWLLVVLILIVLIGGAVYFVVRAKNPQIFGSQEFGIMHEQFRSDRSYSPAVGYYLPPMRLKGTGGAQLDTTRDLKPKPTMIVFEATWCTYCKQEVADLNRIANEGKVNYISLDIHEPISLVDPFVAQNGITHPWYYDEDGSVSLWFLLAGTPTHLIVDKDGKIVERLTGYQTGAQLDAAIARVVK